MEEIRGLAMLLEDSQKVGKEFKYQHIFVKEGFGVWSILSNSGVPPYRDGYRATTMEPLTEDQMRRIIIP